MNNSFIKPKSKKNRKRRADLQRAYTEPEVPPVSLDQDVGALLKETREGHKVVRYEKAACSCCGENPNCYRCDGTGFYAKQVVDEISNDLNLLRKQQLQRNKLQQQTRSIASFSNDARGDSFGIRESGRFSSTPLHDDHD